MDIKYSAVKAPMRGRVHHPVRLGRILVYGVMFLLLTVSLIPLVWVVRTAFIPRELTLDLTAVAWPTLENFRRVLAAAPFGKYYGNTIFIVVGVLVIQFVLITLAGYAFARIDFYGSKALFVLFLSQLMIAPEVLILPNYSMMAKWGLTDTKIGIMLPFFASAMGTLIVRQTIKTIPYELEEAAKMDGGTPRKVFWHITMPLMKPFLALGITSTSVTAINVFDEIVALSGYGDLGKNILMESYLTTFSFLNFGKGSAMTYIVLFFALLLGIFYLRNLNKEVDY